MGAYRRRSSSLYQLGRFVAPSAQDSGISISSMSRYSVVCWLQHLELSSEERRFGMVLRMRKRRVNTLIPQPPQSSIQEELQWTLKVGRTRWRHPLNWQPADSSLRINVVGVIMLAGQHWTRKQNRSFVCVDLRVIVAAGERISACCSCRMKKKKV